MNPLDVTCPYCGALHDRPCKTSKGRKARLHHVKRIAIARQADAVPRKGPKRCSICGQFPDVCNRYGHRRSIVRYRVQAKSYVWCDLHSMIHASANYSRRDPCSKDDWRKVYVESTDRNETF